MAPNLSTMTGHEKNFRIFTAFLNELQLMLVLVGIVKTKVPIFSYTK
jgi:hypothetical protein